MRNIKFKISIGIKYQNPIDYTEIESYHNITRYTANINETTNIDPIIDSYRDKLQEDSDNKIINKSGLIVIEIIFIEIVIFQYTPLAGSSYFKTPTYLPRQTVINVQNKDEKCFMYAILCYHLKEKLKHTERVSSYKDYLMLFNFNNINWPAKEMIIQLLKHRIKIIVYTYTAMISIQVFILFMRLKIKEYLMAQVR